MEGEEAPPPLPPGWTAVQHRELGECYINQVSRACTWSRPRVADTDRPEQHPMPPDEGPLASMCALEEQRAIREAYERARERDNSNFHLAPQERLHRELDRRPSAQYSTFSHVAGSGGQGLGKDGFVLLKRYSNEVLGARVEIEEHAMPGEWPNARPKRVTATILGLTVGEAVSSGHDVARNVAIETALLTLCPLLWMKEVHAQGHGPQWLERGRVFPQPIVEEAVARSLSMDDPRVADLDNCVSKSPAMLVQDYVTLHLGTTLVEHLKVQSGESSFGAAPSRGLLRWGGAAWGC